MIAGVDADFKLPTELSETHLLFDGVRAPLLYTKARLTSAIVPFSVAGKSSTQVEYEYRGVRSNAVTIKVLPAHPGVFTVDSTGQGPGAILDTSYHLITQDNPARKGEYILVFATGGGATRPASVDGQIASAAPIPELVATVTAKIGGVDCPVSYVGGASGLVAGGVQINVLVDPAVPPGAQSLLVSIGGEVSQPGVTVWVR